MSAALPASVVIPLAGGALAFAGGRRAATTVGAAFSTLTAAAAVALGVAVWTDGAQSHRGGGWAAPLGIELAADGLSAAMVLMAAAVGTAVAVYALRSMTDEGERVGFWPASLLLWASLNAIFVSRDVFNLYVALEVMTLSAVGLVVLSRRREALQAGLDYLFAALLGSLAFLLGVALLYGAHGTLDIGLLGERMRPGPAAWTALAVMVAGLALKSALFPLHFWLPPAHASAASPVSAVLSGLVVTASFYLTLRLLAEVFPEVFTLAAGQVLAGLGAAAIAFGSIQAIRQSRVKLLVAYSTVAQVGYLFLALALVLDAGEARWSFAAWAGASYHAIAHACAKAAMFLAAGCLIRSLGHDRIDGLAGAVSRAPVVIFAFGVAGVTLMGLPPSGGFVAKFLLLEAAIGAGQWWWAIVLVAGGLLAAGYVFRVVRAGSAEEREDADPPGRAPAAMQAAALALALASAALGLAAAPLLELLAIGTDDTPLAPEGVE